MVDPILITGVPRSGTSMIAGTIHLCGAFGGSMRGATHNNKKGMFENVRVVNNIAKPFLRELGVDTLGQYPLPDIGTLPIPSDLGDRVRQIMTEEGYKDGPWMYKGAKMTLTWPMWNYAFPNAKWIIVRRKTGDIIQSCLKTSFMRAFQNEHFQRAVGAESEQEGWLWYVHYHEKLFVDMINAGLNIKVVWPERMVDADYKQIYETIDWLGLKWNSEVLSFIDPKLWKARRSANG